METEESAAGGRKRATKKPEVAAAKESGPVKKPRGAAAGMKEGAHFSKAYLP
jgi:hypothetical protein